MGTVVECDPLELAGRAGAWLEGEPVLHNVICTVLARATAEPERFSQAAWFAVEENGEPVGVAIITPPFLLGLTPMSPAALEALVEALTERRPDLPGVVGPSDTPATFARLWAARTGAEVVPGMDQRLFRLDTVVAPAPAPGCLRPAAEDDRGLLEEWFAAFVTEAGAISGDIAVAVDRWLRFGGLHLWQDGERVTMTGAVAAVAGVVRVGPVYTPPVFRGRGYASNCVAAVTQQALDRGADACMLYTDLANPTSNAIYQRLGYRPVADAQEFLFRYA